MLCKTQIKETKNFGAERLNKRIDYAKYLLVQTLEPLKTVAADCGWKSERAFASAFERRVGVTPVHYRNWHQC